MCSVLTPVFCAEALAPIIDPVLEKNFTIEAGRKFIKLGDKSVEWDDVRGDADLAIWRCALIHGFQNVVVL